MTKKRRNIGNKMKFKIKKLSPKDTAYMDLLRLTRSGEIAKIGLGEVGKIVTRLYPDKDSDTLSDISLAWASTSPKVLTRLAEKEHPEINYALVHNAHSPPEALDIILKRSNSPITRGMAAQHEHAPSEALGDAVTSGHVFEQLEALANPNTPLNAVLGKISDPDEDVQAALELRFRRMLRKKPDKK